MKLNIALCDDEKSEIQYLTELINRWAESSGNTAVIKSYISAESFLFDYEDGKNCDILLLDIQMSGMDGVQLAKTVREHNRSIQIIFVTGFGEYISSGYDVGALHYLIKPVGYAKLSDVLTRAAELITKNEPAVIFSSGGENIRIRLSDIFCIEALGHTITLKFASGELDVTGTLASLKETLGDNFRYTHRSFLVNLEHIKRISKSEITLDNGMTVPVSRRMYDDINRAFCAYYRR